MIVLRYCFVISPEVWKPFTTLVPGPIRAPHRSYWALIDPDTKVIRMCGPQFWSFKSISTQILYNIKQSIISLLLNMDTLSCDSSEIVDKTKLMNMDTYKILEICVLTGQMLRLWSGL